MSRARVNSPAGYMIQPGVRSVAVNAFVGVCFGGMVARACAVTAASGRRHEAGLVPVTGTLVCWYVAGYRPAERVAHTRRGARTGRRIGQGWGV